MNITLKDFIQKHFTPEMLSNYTVINYSTKSYPKNEEDCLELMIVCTSNNASRRTPKTEGDKLDAIKKGLGLR